MKHCENKKESKEKRVCIEKFAKRLEKNATKSELILKAELERRKIKFEFQKVLHGRIPDFYFPKYDKIVELDGKKFHDQKKDQKRDKMFLENGIGTYRIRSHRVFKELGKVMKEINRFLSGKHRIPKKRRKKKKKKRKNSPAWKRVAKVDDSKFKVVYK